MLTQVLYNVVALKFLMRTGGASVVGLSFWSVLVSEMLHLTLQAQFSHTRGAVQLWEELG